MLAHVSHWLHRRLLWLLLIAYAAATVLPGPGLRLRESSLGTLPLGGHDFKISILLLLLALLLFNAGLGMKLSDMRALTRIHKLLTAGLLANIVVPISYAVVITLLMRSWHNPDETQNILVGLALVATMPIAGSSTAWTQNTDGHLPLSLALVLCSTLLSPLATPLALHFFASMASGEYREALDHLASYGTGPFLGLWVVLPALMGLGVRYMLGDATVAAWKPTVKMINAVVLLVLNYSNAAVSLPQTIAHPDPDFLLVTLPITLGLCLAMFAFAFLLGRLLHAERDQIISLAYGLGMNNNGTALVLASLALAQFPRVMIPIIFYNLLQHIVAGGLHQFLTAEKRYAKPLPSAA
ncbi:MAG TPA: bile acid:sodium symporter [Nitrospiraceae bacterium]|nr:bile acid:sodium symporter [Nitrospiraceae bacterium]